VKVSGQIPRAGDTLVVVGRVGAELALADAAPDVPHTVPGDAGRHTRTSLGVFQLPKNASVALNLIAAVG
jgi:enamine deaminase RidA (YjgF/YER057c/UK114 family)